MQCFLKRGRGGERKESEFEQERDEERNVKRADDWEAK